MESVAESLDMLLGTVEWLKTDQLKKGSKIFIKDLEELSFRIEKISKTLSDKDGDEAPSTAGAEGKMKKYSDTLVSSARQVGKIFQKIAGDRSVPRKEDIKKINDLLGKMENELAG